MSALNIWIIRQTLRKKHDGNRSILFFWQRSFVRSLHLERAWFRIVYTLGSSFFFSIGGPMKEKERKGGKTSRNRSKCIFVVCRIRGRERGKEKKERVRNRERGIVSCVRQEPAWCKKASLYACSQPLDGVRLGRWWQRRAAISMRNVRTRIQVAVVSHSALQVRVRPPRITIHLYLHPLRQVLLSAGSPQAAHPQHPRKLYREITAIVISAYMYSSVYVWDTQFFNSRFLRPLKEENLFTKCLSCSLFFWMQYIENWSIKTIDLRCVWTTLNSI